MSTKFVVYGQSRSGSTLLVELINTHPEVRCDGELFNQDADRIGNRVLLSLVRAFPMPYISYKRRRAAGKAYGFKFLFYHLPMARQVMRMLALTGWKFVHVYRRNVARQSLSNIVAETTQRWHKREDDRATSRIRVSNAGLRREIEIRHRWRAREIDLIAPIDHLDLCYEDDLEREADWPATADKLSRFLGLAPFKPGDVSLKKILSGTDDNLIENYAELKPLLDSSEIASGRAAARMVPKDDPKVCAMAR
jgi:LPS sulfotransferase NodH